MTNNYTNQIIAILQGEVNINTVSQEVIDIMLADFPYSPYSHLIHYLKAKASNHPDTKELLHTLAAYSPDRAWLQEVLKTSFSDLEMSAVSTEEIIPSEAKDPNLDTILFEFDFNQSTTTEHSEPILESEASSTIERPINVESSSAHVANEAEAESPKHESSIIESDAREPEELSSYTLWLKSLSAPKGNESSETTQLPENIAPPPPEKKKTEEKNTRKDDDLFGGIITETLAELLANQGQTEKAIHMYERLSLIFPDKSAFFAAKIDQLNNNIA